MREIKFRVWNPELERMYKIKKENYLGSVGIIDNLVGGKESEWMQYTGLKDKNGVEIYEWDIVSTDLDRPYLIVEFRNGAFMFQCHDNGKDYYDFMSTTGENSNFTKYHEVIGNIYEHPHLIEEETE